MIPYDEALGVHQQSEGFTRHATEGAEVAAGELVTTFDPDAVRARGLSAILEESMLEVMYDLPSRRDIKGCRIDESVVLGTGSPEFTFRQRKQKTA